MKKYLIILGALMASLASPHAFGVESVSREASAPVIYYEGDIETSASAPEGSLVTVYTCFSKESLPFLNSICPEKPFEERFSKVVFSLPEGIHWLNFIPTGNLQDVGFTCTSESQFNEAISYDKRNLVLSGFDCKIMSTSDASIFKMFGFAAAERKSSSDKIFRLRSTIQTNGGAISTRTVETLFSPPVGFWSTGTYPHGLPCLAVVAPGGHYCWAP